MRLLLPACVLVGLLAFACTTTSDVETADIVTTIPWADEEEAEYIIVNPEDLEDEFGRATLGVRRLNGEFEFRFDFENEIGTDESTVVVDAETLRPDLVRREIHTEDLDTIIEGTYDRETEILTVLETQDGEERTIPSRLEEEHYYDNESSLYLWRTITFEEGFETAYHTVLANFGGETHVVEIEVEELVEVTVPAGTYMTWRLRVSTAGRSQLVWYADTPERLLIAYNNDEGQLFQLVTPPEGLE